MVAQNPLVAQGIVDKASLNPSDRVLEVGPGTGNLTVRILEKCKHCTAVEMDPRMAAELSKRLQGKPEMKRLDILVGDFVKADLPPFDVCISNTPYQVRAWASGPVAGAHSVREQISSPLVFRLLSHRPLFRRAILMFQREFALRLCARPGTSLWCRLSANVQLYARVDHIMKVGKGNFRPPPQVESSVVRIEPIVPQPSVRFEEFDGLTRICFSRRNKTIRACFSAKGVSAMLEANWRTWCAQQVPAVAPTDSIADVIEDILSTSGYSDQRAAKMDVDDFLSCVPSPCDSMVDDRATLTDSSESQSARRFPSPWGPLCIMCEQSSACNCVASVQGDARYASLTMRRTSCEKVGRLKHRAHVEGASDGEGR